jgi:histidyl-tRNA synthetase
LLTTRPRGTNDFLPQETEKWQLVEKILREICAEFDYHEIRIPIFEHTELFQRGVGETTDIVEKEMYTFEDRGKRSITLRPEGTASTVRAYLEHKMSALPQPVKLYYMGPMFRYERPQAGRYRQFHQFGVEVFGSSDPGIDAEVIGLAMVFYQRLGLTGLEVRLNSVGCPKCRPTHRQLLQEFLKQDLEHLCPDCQGRFNRNPLRILDCKNPQCQKITTDAPTVLSSLCSECADHFTSVKEYLEMAGVKYQIDDRMVRGLDYYTKTAFEIIVQEIGAQSAICGGGRYDGLVESLGGPPTPGVGFALGLERIFPTLASQGIELSSRKMLDVYLVAIEEKGHKKAFQLLMNLRKMGIKAEKDYMNRSMKAQMKAANRFNVKYVLILGEDELARDVIMVRNMETSEQKEMMVSEALNFMEQTLK